MPQGHPIDDHPAVVSLSTDETACLKALRGGMSRKKTVADATGLSLYKVTRTLETLRIMGLADAVTASPGARQDWLPTPLGAGVEIKTGGSAARKLPPSAQRLLDCLDQPRTNADLARRMGVSRERIRQIVNRLRSDGAIKVSAPGPSPEYVARIDDPRPFLDGLQVAALSRLSEEGATSVHRLAGVLKISPEQAHQLAEGLRAADLVNMDPSIMSDRPQVRLTEAGANHPQRKPVLSKVKPDRLPMYSDRVLSVLTYLAHNGPTQTAQIGRDLGIGFKSMNALMQYLKRRGIAYKTGSARYAPHALTEKGHQLRDELSNRASSSPPASP